MAIVQQLARPTPEQLARCRESVDELDRLCSFNMLPASDHLDLDWAPTPLERLGRLTPLSPEVESAIHTALSDGVEINPGHREHPDSIWGHPVSSLEPSEVAQIASVLSSIDPAKVIAGLPRWKQRLRSTLFDGQKISDPKRYLLEHLTALRSFYMGASDMGRAVVLWWD